MCSNLDYTAAGNYSVTVSNALGTTTSPNIALAVRTPDTLGALVLADHPAPAAKCALIRSPPPLVNTDVAASFAAVTWLIE